MSPLTEDVIAFNSPEEINKRFAKAAGIKQRSWITKGMDGKLYTHSDPDFCANPLLVLEVMSKRDGWDGIFSYLEGFEWWSTKEFVEMFLFDKTGLLALKEAEYLETEGGKK